MASRRDNAVLMAVEENKREFDLLWNQGIKPLRQELQDVKADIKKVDEKVDKRFEKLINDSASAKRWLIGLVLATIPAYIGLVVELTKR
jgi:hypothetical protein